MDEQVTIEGYIARSSGWPSKSANEFNPGKDNEGALSLHTTKPDRMSWFWHSNTGNYIMLSKPGEQTMFKELGWTNEPLEVEITIKVKR